MQEKNLTTEEKARKAKAAYSREWRRKNPEKWRKVMDDYWARRYDRMVAEM